ncbi:hypothetical protein M8J75_008370 [Diaphorina citri]|nr:hypothetical protein M8J75_008370 [Diaphorina citri]
MNYRVLLYELHAPLMVRISRNSQAGNISKPALKKQLRKVISCLKEAVSILSFECPTTQEGQMASAAREALTEIYNWEKYVGKL